MTMEKVIKNLRSLRRKSGYSQEYVADLAGISVSTVSRIESSPECAKLGNICKLCSVYNVSPAVLFSQDENEPILTAILTRDMIQSIFFKKDSLTIEIS